MPQRRVQPELLSLPEVVQLLMDGLSARELWHADYGRACLDQIITSLAATVREKIDEGHDPTVVFWRLADDLEGFDWPVDGLQGLVAAAVVRIVQGEVSP